MTYQTVVGDGGMRLRRAQPSECWRQPVAVMYPYWDPFWEDYRGSAFHTLWYVTPNEHRFWPSRLPIEGGPL